MGMRQVGLATVAVLTLAACGDGAETTAPASTVPVASSLGSTVASTSTSTPAPGTAGGTAAADDVETSIRAYASAYFGGDYEAVVARASARCRGQYERASYQEVVDQYAARFPDAEPAEIAIDVLDDASAAASYVLVVDGAPVDELTRADEHWILEDGAWVNDEC